MVQINIDTQKDSPETIKKIIEILHAVIKSDSSNSAVLSSDSYKNSSFNVFDNPSQSSFPLPSSAPVSNVPSMFDVFGSEDKPNSQFSQHVVSSNPFSMFDKPIPSTTTQNTSAGFANNDLFDLFSNDLPSTDFRSSNSSLQSTSLKSSFSFAQNLLDDDSTSIQDKEDEPEPEEKSSDFFNFEQY